MTDLMSRRLTFRTSICWVDRPDGLHILGGPEEVRLRGEGMAAWLGAIHGMLDGRCLAEILESIAPRQADHIRSLVAALVERGVITDIGDGVSPEVVRDVLRGDSALIRTWREQRIVVLCDGAEAAELAAPLIRALEQLGVERRPRVVTELSAVVGDEQEEPPTLLWIGTGVAAARELDEWSLSHRTPTLAVVLHQHEAWLGALVRVGAGVPGLCDLVLSTRPSTGAENVDSSTTDLSGTEVLAGRIAYHLLNALAASPAETADPLYRMTAVSRSRGTVARRVAALHPVSPAGRATRTESAAHGVGLDGELSVAEFSRRCRLGIDQDFGLVAALDERSLPQLPLKVSRCTLRNGEVRFGAATTYEEARVAAMLAGLTAVAAQFAGLSSAPRDQLCPPDQRFPHEQFSTYSQASQLNPAGRSQGAVAGGLSLPAAIIAGLLEAAQGWYVREPGLRGRPMALGAATSLRYADCMLSAVGERLEILDVTCAPGIPAVLARSGSTTVLRCGIDLDGAANAAALSLLRSRQADLSDIPLLSQSVILGDVAFGTPTTALAGLDVPGLARALAETGHRPTVTLLDQHPALYGWLGCFVQVVLDD